MPENYTIRIFVNGQELGSWKSKARREAYERWPWHVEPEELPW